MKKILFFILMPLYVTAILFLDLTLKWWESLAE